MSRQNRKRSAPSNFDEWNHDDTDEDTDGLAAAARTTKLRHTHFNLGSGGSKMSSQTNYITAPASPEKVSRPEASASAYEDMDNLPELEECPDSDGEEDGEEDGGAFGGEAELDVQYQRHLIDVAARMPRRKRTTMVSDAQTSRALD